MEKISKAKLTLKKGCYDDDLEYVDFINYVFGFNGKDRSFYKLLPKLFKDGRSPAENTYFVKDEKGKILSCVGAFPLKMSICGSDVKALGIGNVAVHPRCRGQNLMIDPMKAALADAVYGNCDIAILSGKRTRYNHFGFEKCGTDSVYTVSVKSLRDVLGNALPRLEMKRLSESDSELLDEIFEMHNRVRKYRFERKRDDLYDILCSWQAVPYFFLKDGHFIGWAVKGNDTVTELVLDDYSYTGDALLCLMQGCHELNFLVPDFERECKNALFYYAETVYTGADLCFSVFNYKKMLTLLLNLKSSCESLADGSVNVLINGYKRSFKLTLKVENGLPSVTDCPEEADIVLSHLDAMRLFFMESAPNRNILPAEVRSWFPLPIYVFHADNV